MKGLLFTIKNPFSLFRQSVTGGTGDVWTGEGGNMKRLLLTEIVPFICFDNPSLLALEKYVPTLGSDGNLPCTLP